MNKGKLFAGAFITAFAISSFSGNVFAADRAISYSSRAASTSNFEFDSSTKTLKKYNGTAAYVTIPASINGVDVEYIGNGAFYNNTSTKSITLPSGLKGINYNAFLGAKALQSINIPGGVEKIGRAAFSGCTALSSVTIAEGVKKIEGSAFESCTALVGIDLPDSLESLGDSSFGNCTSLINFEIPVGISNFDYYVLTGCSNLENITVAEGNKSYKAVDGVLYNTAENKLVLCPPKKIGEYIVADNTEIIGEHAFAQCDKLTNVVLPSSVESIAESAFCQCTEITDIKLSENLKNIGDEAFRGCISLANIALPNSLTDIGLNAFSECTAIKSIALPKGVANIGNGAFGNCSSLTAIEVDNDNASYEDIDGVLFSKDGKRLISYPAGKGGAYTVPDGVETIASMAISYCEELTELTVPEGVVSIENFAICRCANLSSITIGFSAKDISDFSIYMNNIQNVYCYKNSAADNAELYYNQNGESVNFNYLSFDSDCIVPTAAAVEVENYGYIELKEDKARGTISAYSINNTDNTNANIELKITAPCVLYFESAVSSEKGKDICSIDIDGSRFAEISGVDEYTNENPLVGCVVLDEGEHTFIWSYSKDDELSDGEDCAWLNNLRVVNIGDVNIDGKIDIADAIMAEKLSEGEQGSEQIINIAAATGKTGQKATKADVARILKRLIFESL